MATISTTAPSSNCSAKKPRGLGIEVLSLDIRKLDDVDAAFDKAIAFGTKGLLNAVDTFINSRRFALSARAAKHKLPFVYSDVEYVLAGGLITLGPGHYEGYHDATKYVDEYLHGANPADLPIAGPTQFTMERQSNCPDQAWTFVAFGCCRPGKRVDGFLGASVGRFQDSFSLWVQTV